MDVIDIDGGDHGRVRIEHVDGVEPPSDADLEHRGVNPRRPEDLDCGEGPELEVGQGDPAPRPVDPIEGGHDCGVRNQLPIDPDALVVGDEMR